MDFDLKTQDNPQLSIYVAIFRQYLIQEDYLSFPFSFLSIYCKYFTIRASKQFFQAYFYSFNQFKTILKF